MLVRSAPAAEAGRVRARKPRLSELPGFALQAPAKTGSAAMVTQAA